MTTAGGLLVPLAVLLPFVGVLIGVVLGGRALRTLALITIVLGIALALAIADAWLQGGSTLVYALGGWLPPLGIALRADGAAVVMLLTVALVVLGIAVYARDDFAMPTGGESRAAWAYWLLLLSVWGALNLVFVSGDLFTLYVALELLTFAGVPLVCLAGSGETLRAALRYLLFALGGSVLYLLGAVLLYGGYGTLDMPLLAERVQPGPIATTALALMTVGLLAKTALFPLHIWLPPAHGGAPAAASAVLSALVIKGSWFLVLRLWFDALPGVVTWPAAQLLGALGAGAILFGNLVALRQVRLKMLVAYSTVAQIGYLFLLFPLAFEAGRIADGMALAGGLMHAVSHATAKSAMFLAVGSIYSALGHDRIADLAGVARALPVSVFAFGLGGISLVGLPPAGGFLAKWWLLSAAVSSGAMVVGGGADGRRPAHGRIPVCGGVAHAAGTFNAAGVAGAGGTLPRTRHAGAGAGLGAARAGGAVRSAWVAEDLMDRAALLIAVLAWPLALLAACLWRGVRDRLPWLLPLAPLPALAAALLCIGMPPLRLGQGSWAPVLMLDLPGAILLGTAALLWLLAALYALRYMQGSANLARFGIGWLMTLTGCLGAFVAADMVSLYLLLGVLSVGACTLVIHDQTPPAWRGGGMYLGLALFGESCALMGFVLLASHSPDGSLLIRDAVSALRGSPQRDLTLALLIVGLGLKAGLVPLHMWMPLAHAAAPVPASAVLSGAVVKVGIVGLMRFLPLGAAMPDWGQALAAVGLFTALYGVAIGITQQHPKAVLAYSSVSQMGVIAAVLGMGWSVGDASAAAAAAFYASHHVLVKGTLFLSVGLVAATAAPARLWPVLLVAAVLGLGLGGLPLTGGALAKYAVKGPLGDGLAGTIGKVSAAGTTLLVLHFVFRLRAFASKESGDAAPAGLWWPWALLAIASLIVPWWLYILLPGGAVDDVLAPAALWAALLPMIAGAAAAWLLRRFGSGLPQVPLGDLVRLIDAALDRCRAAGPALLRADAVLLQWPAALLLLMALVLGFGLALAGASR